jgi:hypothetical protein
MYVDASTHHARMDSVVYARVEHRYGIHNESHGLGDDSLVMRCSMPERVERRLQFGHGFNRELNGARVRSNSRR